MSKAKQHRERGIAQEAEIGSRHSMAANSRLALVMLVVALAAALAVTPSHAITAQFLPPNLPPMRAGEQKSVVAILRGDSAKAKTVRVTLKAPRDLVVSPSYRAVTLQPGRKAAAFFKVKATAKAQSSATVVALVNSTPVGSMGVGVSYDLGAVAWRAAFDKDGVGVAQGWMKPGFDDAAWATWMLPRQWSDGGITYLRAKLFVPESWRGKAVHLRLRAVDDADVCYLNGVEIGRTDGWDARRDYKIGPKMVRYGQENLLCIAVNNNPGGGGGIYWTPNTFGIAEPQRIETRTARLAAPGKIGSPMPFRRMLVKNGVLVYEDGGEVCLWGVNYYPQSWNQFHNMKQTGVDMHKAIRDDLDDMKQMGVEVIRIHVFDREISDADGGLLDNEHSELLDYLVSEATKRGIYFMFTPIGWWGSKGDNPASFSAVTPKEYMFCDDAAIKAQANYLKNWLNHVNRYTGRAYKNEPAVCLLEIMNEPAYVDYPGIVDASWAYFTWDRDRVPEFKARYIKKWQAWCASNGVACDQAFWPLFRYEVMSRYLETMYKSIRGTGAKQPVACSIVETNQNQDLIEAIADSRCEAITLGGYIGNFNDNFDRVNLLPQLGNTALDPLLNRKARAIYEFDALRTMDSYLYPALARRFRNQGAQICAMFQYDSRVTAERNSDWNVHYLNYYYTPSKAVSHMIGGKAFHELPRGSAFPTTGTTQFFGHCAVSFDRNVSVYSTDDCYLNSAPFAGWRPTKAPEKPRYVTSVGDSPYASYSGTGIYSLVMDYPNKIGKLTVNSDAVRVGDPWNPDGVRSVVELRNEAHSFRLNMVGINLSGVTKFDVGGDRGSETSCQGNAFQAGPEVYYLTWRE